MDLITKYFSDFTEEQLKQFAALENLYKDWNQKINVISRKDINSLYEKHVLHSLSIAAIFEFENGSEIIDIGTGGGFPGIPLAIYFPEVKIHLVDSIGKKLKVVEAVAGGIGLKNVTTQHIRAEEIRNRKFDFVVSRAVAELKDLWKWAKPLLKTQDTRYKAQERHLPSLKLRQAGKGEESRGKDYRVADALSIKLRQNDKEQGNEEPAFANATAGKQGTRNEEQDRDSLKPGLICLKGGDLAQEIHDSHTRPHVYDISEIFEENSFKEKYILYIKK
jgi:16S rRNA (guanine527-N7)-methyltransferase